MHYGCSQFIAKAHNLCCPLPPCTLLPQIDKVFNVTSQLDIPMLPQGDSGLPNATICDIAFYSGGGYCLECPFRTVTQAKGAKSIEECSEYLLYCCGHSSFGLV